MNAQISEAQFALKTGKPTRTRVQLKVLQLAAKVILLVVHTGLNTKLELGQQPVSLSLRKGAKQGAKQK